MSLSVKLAIPTRIQPEVMPQPGMAGVYTNQLHYFKKHLLDELGKKKFASDFMNPVDTEELQIPHYYSVIHRPMDVGTITKRVENNYYRDVEEAIADFRLLIRNCYMFNGPDTLVYRKGVQLEKFFLRAIKNIPKGPPVPCNKDPMSTCKLKANPMAGILEQECRNQLRSLQTFTNQADATARNFFGPKWNSFSAKLDKQFFKTLEEFRSHVDGMFKKYHDQARQIYEKVYDQPGGFEGNDFTSACASPSDRAIPTSSICLTESEVSDLLLAVQLTQNGLNQCLKHPQRSKALAETFEATMAQFKLKLEAIKAAIPAQNNGENSRIGEEKQVPASLYLPTDGLEFLVDTPDAGLSDDDPKLDPIDLEERRSIQTQFGTLPSWAMREICGFVHSSEDLGRDSGGGFTFDLNYFKLPNVQIMKSAVQRALKFVPKVNLRDMLPEEKEGLRCSLQSQLSNITDRLNPGRRKNAAPSVSDKNNKKSKKNGSKKKGKKRAKPADPEPEVETKKSKSADSQLEPGSPERREAGETETMFCTPTKDTQAGNKSKKSKKEKSTAQSHTPKRNYQANRTPLKTPIKWLPGARMTIKKTPIKKVTKVSKKNKSRVRVRGGNKAAPLKPEPPAKIHEKVKKIKTLADTSSDEEEHHDKYNEAPCSSTKKKSKKGKKKAKKPKAFLCITPGNVLESDLDLSSSSSDAGGGNSSDDD